MSVLAPAALVLALAGRSAASGQVIRSTPGIITDPVAAGVEVGIRLAATAAAAGRDGGTVRTPTPQPPPSDQATLDALIASLYDAVSHGDGLEPDWGRLEPLFVTGARLTPPKPAGDTGWRALSFEEFRDAFRAGIAALRDEAKPAGFFEREIGREVRRYGSLTNVLSAYEARFRRDDSKPFLRGVNSIQVVKSGDRYKIVSIVWETERPGSPIPPALLSGSK